MRLRLQGHRAGGFPMTTRTFVLPAAVVLAVSLLSACGSTGDDPDGAPSGSASEAASSSSAASASEASADASTYSPSAPGVSSADGPAQNVPKPQKPALADEESYEGAQAFLDYLADARAYAWQTGDTSLIREITAEDTCYNCYDEYERIEGLYRDGGWATSGQESIEIIDRDMPVGSGGEYAPRVRVGFEGIRIWDQSGELIQKEPPNDRSDDFVYNHMDFNDGRWVHLMVTESSL